jgi:hypothetical protein
VARSTLYGLAYGTVGALILLLGKHLIRHHGWSADSTFSCGFAAGSVVMFLAVWHALTKR